MLAWIVAHPGVGWTVWTLANVALLIGVTFWPAKPRPAQPVPLHQCYPDPRSPRVGGGVRR